MKKKANPLQGRYHKELVEKGVYLVGISNHFFVTLAKDARVLRVAQEGNITYVALNKTNTFKNPRPRFIHGCKTLGVSSRYAKRLWMAWSRAIHLVKTGKLVDFDKLNARGTYGTWKGKVNGR